MQIKVNQVQRGWSADMDDIILDEEEETSKDQQQKQVENPQKIVDANYKLDQQQNENLRPP